MKGSLNILSNRLSFFPIICNKVTRLCRMSFQASCSDPKEAYNSFLKRELSLLVLTWLMGSYLMVGEA